MTSVERARQLERIVGSGADDFDRVRSRVEDLARLGAECLVVPLRVTLARGDQVAITEPPRDNDTLRTLLDSRGTLRAGECVWLGTGVAQALVVLHKNGLVHGALDVDAIVVEQGQVRLARLVDGDNEAIAADDVAALGRLLAAAVRESDADRIVAWTEPMTHPDPNGRPTAAMVVRALASCAPPEVLQLPPTGVASALRRAAASGRDSGAQRAVELHESRWWRMRVRAVRALKHASVVVAALVIVGGIGAGVARATHSGPWASAQAPAGALTGGTSTRDPKTTPSGEADSPDSGESLQVPENAGERLTLARFDALSRGDGEALIALTVMGSDARADADATAAALRNDLLKVEGLEGHVEDSVSLSDSTAGPPSEGDHAVVRVRYRLSPHVVISDAQSTTYEGYEQTVDLTLEWVTGLGWLVSEANTSL